MGNFLINQKIKKIKVFDSFDSLIKSDDGHTFICSVMTELKIKKEKRKEHQKYLNIKDFDSFDTLIN